MTVTATTNPRREAGYRWFTRWLQGAENTEPEAPLSLATEEELQCTRTGQVQTEFPGAADVFSLNRKLADQLRASRKPDAASVRKFAAELSYYDAANRPASRHALRGDRAAHIQSRKADLRE